MSGSRQVQQQDEEMSDADSEGEEDGGDDQTVTGNDTPQEAAALGEHIGELVRRRDQSINQRIIAAWEQGRSLPPDIEQYLKEQSERGTLGVGTDLSSFISRYAPHGYLPLASQPTSAAANAVAPRAAA